MGKIIMAALVIFYFWANLVTAGEPAVTLDELVARAMAVNPEIAAARRQAEAARQRVSQAGALDDPMLGFAVINIPGDLDFGAEDMTMKELSLSQRFPFFGKRSLKRDAAIKDADSFTFRIEDRINQIVKNVQLVFYDLSHVHRAIEVTRRNKTILEDFSRLAQTRYGVGQGIQEDVIRVQVEISRMIDDLLMLDQKKETFDARLNQLLNNSMTTPMGVPAQWAFRPQPLNLEKLQQTALANNPLLKAMRSRIDGQQTNLSLARRDIFPDVNLKIAYGQRDDRPDLYTAGLEMNLPIFAGSKQNRKVDESLAELRSEQAEFQAARNEIFFMIADVESMARRLEKQIELYTTGIIPQTSYQIQSALSAYTVNKADFMTLLDSRMRLYRFELEYHQAVTEYAKNLALLESLVGIRLAGMEGE